MTRQAKCPHCSARYAVADAALGRSATCKNCGRSFQVEDARVKGEAPREIRAANEAPAHSEIAKTPRSARRTGPAAVIGALILIVFVGTVALWRSHSGADEFAGEGQIGVSGTCTFVNAGTPSLTGWKVNLVLRSRAPQPVQLGRCMILMEVDALERSLGAFLKVRGNEPPRHLAGGDIDVGRSFRAEFACGDGTHAECNGIARTVVGPREQHLPANRQEERNAKPDDYGLLPAGADLGIDEVMLEGGWLPANQRERCIVALPMVSANEQPEYWIMVRLHKAEDSPAGERWNPVSLKMIRADRETLAGIAEDDRAGLPERVLAVNWLVGALGEDAAPTLDRVLASVRDGELACVCFVLMERIRARDGASRALNVLENPAAPIEHRCVCARYLGAIKHMEAEPALRSLMDHDVRAVSGCARLALVDLGYSDAMNDVARFVQEFGLGFRFGTKEPIDPP